MKVFLQFLLSWLPCSFLMGQQASSLYKLSFPVVGADSVINMVDYQGKKILVAVSDAGDPDKKLLHQLDELQLEYQSKLLVIVIPVNDLSNSSRAIDSNEWQLATNKCRVTRLSAAKKASGKAQHPLLQWLTNKTNNQHFDQDVKSDGYWFVISETGRLFALLKYSNHLDSKALQHILESKVPDN